jgi:hypothetical protein
MKVDICPPLVQKAQEKLTGRSPCFCGAVGGATEVVSILMFLQIGGKFVKAEQYGEEVEEEEELILSQVYVPQSKYSNRTTSRDHLSNFRLSCRPLMVCFLGFDT